MSVNYKSRAVGVKTHGSNMKSFKPVTPPHQSVSRLRKALIAELMKMDTTGLKPN